MLPGFESQLAFHCAPALAGIKPSNLISLSAASFPGLPLLLPAFNAALPSEEIRLELLGEIRRHFLVLVYREGQLTRHLRDKTVQALLSQAGYPVEEGMSAALMHLKKRLDRDGEFPHEIGLFLGYPTEDVLGFMKHRGKAYKLSGYWKVYGNEEQARALFERYTHCRALCCAQMAKGKSIAQLFCAG